MPPQLGTLTPDVAAAIRTLRRGRAEYRVDRTSIVHVPVGKVSLSPEQLYLNIGALAQSLVAAGDLELTAGKVQWLHRAGRVAAPRLVFSVAADGSARAFMTVFHLMPAGKAAPPRPRRPDFVISSTKSAGRACNATRNPRPPPWAS